MFSIAQLSLLLTLIPLLVGLALVGFGSRLSQRTATITAVVAAALTALVAVLVAAAAFPDAPMLVTLIAFSNAGLVHRLDSFSAYLILGIACWVAPVLLWMTAPRTKADATQQPSVRPLGWALLAVGLALGAVLMDNVLWIALCWGGVGFIAWCMGRPDAAFRPTSQQEWLDLPLLTLGPVLFALAMIFPMNAAKTLSLYDMSNHTAFNFATGFLVLLVLFFAAGLYPFIIWVRRVAQGVLPEAVGVLLLLLTPIGIALFGRMVVLLAPNGIWPTLHIGPATFALNAVALILGIASVIVCGVVLLFEQDLLVITALLNALVLAWCAVAIGTGDNHALVGLTLLLLVQTLGVGALMAVWGSLEWSDRELRVAGLEGLARDMPSHFLVVLLASLTLVGVPLLSGFAAMATIDQGILSEGGTAALGGALIWIGNALALLGIVRIISRAVRQSVDDTDAPVASTWETVGLLVPVALLLLIGIAPELLFLGKAPIWGPTISAAAALLPIGTSFNDLALTPLGFTLGGLLWVPGVVWALGIVATGVVALCAGRIGAEATPSPVFVGGESYSDPSGEQSASWYDLAPLALSPLLLPGPANWRLDLADADEWSQDLEEDDVEVVEESTFVYADDEEEETDIINDDDMEDLEDEDAAPVDTVDAEKEIITGPTIIDSDAVIIESNAATNANASQADAPQVVEADETTPPLNPRPRPPANNPASSRKPGKGGQNNRGK